MNWEDNELNKHLLQLDEGSAREEYLEEKTRILTLDLLAGATIWIKKDSYNIIDFTADVEMSNQCMVNILQDDTADIKELFNNYCEKVANLLIDNEKRERL